MTKKSFYKGKEEIIYYRPSKARKIPLKASSNRGFHPSLKPHLKGQIFEYESQLERDFIFLLDQDPNCYDLQTQPIKIEYITKSGRKESIFPDCWAIFIDGKEYLFEIKSESQLQKLIEDKNWELKNKAIQEFCKKRNWIYQVITEKKIRCSRLNNIKDLLVSTKHFSPAKINKNIGAFDSNLKKLLNKAPRKFGYVARFLKSFLPLSLEEVISLLKFKTYYQQIFINWDIPLEETILFLNEQYPIPVYNLPEITSIEIQDNPSINVITDKKTAILFENDQKTYQDRLNLITPIINKYGKEAKKPEILEFCTKNKKSFQRTYRWYLKWRKGGESALVPQRNKKHSKSHLDPRVELLLQQAIYSWNHGESQHIKAAYDSFRVECYKLGLKPAGITTFRNRIKALPSSEKRGKFNPRTQKNIKKGIVSSYREGRYPGCVIQMDHTLLDIWLVDYFTKQPLGRPWMTMGIDTFSRAIWGFFISFNPPSQESVTQAILNGLISKKFLLEWKIFEAQLLKAGKKPSDYKYECGGFPALIQVDNGKDFRADLVKNFCVNNNITLEFRPIKTPEYGGFIESVWDTINDGIRGAKLKGRVFSLPRSREPVKRPIYRVPQNYNPKEDAALTLDDFKEWLFTFLIIKYTNFTKARQLHSPVDAWCDGLRGNNHQPMGGAIRTLSPSEFEELDFHSKISVSSKLSNVGLR